MCTYKKFQDMGSSFYKAYVSYTRLTRGAILVNNEDCVKKVVNKLYWDSWDEVKKTEGDAEGQGKYIFLAVAIVVVFITALVLLTLYYKRQIAAHEAKEGYTLDTTEAQATAP